jgi:hypothetical protein
MSTDFEDLCGRFEALKKQFSRASSDWPNFQSVFITWPEDKPEPENLPTKLQGQSAVNVPAPKGKAHHVMMLTGSATIDRPGFRFRKGVAGKLIYRRSFGKFYGDPQVIQDPDEEKACNDRFKVLSEEGSDLLKKCGVKIGLSENTLMWGHWETWVLALHETLNPEAQPLRKWHTVENEWDMVQVIEDIFLASENAITIWVRRLKTARSRSGRLKDVRITRRNLRIKQLCEKRKLHSQWAKLAEVANADEQIQALNLDNRVTRDIARNAVQPPKKRRK